MAQKVRAVATRTAAHAIAAMSLPQSAAALTLARHPKRRRKKRPKKTLTRQEQIKDIFTVIFFCAAAMQTIVHMIRGRIHAVEAPGTCIGFAMPLTHIYKHGLEKKDVFVEIEDGKIVVRVNLHASDAQRNPHKTTWTILMADEFPPDILRTGRTWRVTDYTIFNTTMSMHDASTRPLRLVPVPRSAAAANATLVKIPAMSRPPLALKRTLEKAAVNDDGDHAEPTAKRRRMDEVVIPPPMPPQASPACASPAPCLGGETEEECVK